MDNGDLEITSHVLKSALKYGDGMRNSLVIRLADTQPMFARIGVAHSEFNAPITKPATLCKFGQHLIPNELNQAINENTFLYL